MNKNQVSSNSPLVFISNMRFKRISSPVAAIQATELEIMQEKEEEAMVSFIRAKREGRAKRAALRDRKEENRVSFN